MSKDHIEKKRRKAKETLASFQIHTKMGRERFLGEVAKYYCAMYPARARFFKKALNQLRQVTTAKYIDQRGREAYVNIRVPQELLLFIQRWIPDFAQDSEDIELLKKVWCDLVIAHKDHRRKSLIYRKPSHVRGKPAKLHREGTPS